MLKASDKAIADKSQDMENQNTLKDATAYVETVRESEVAENEAVEELEWDDAQRELEEQAQLQAEQEAAVPEKELESLSQLQKQITVNFNPNEFEKENAQPVVMSQRSLGGHKNPSG